MAPLRLHIVPWLDVLKRRWPVLAGCVLVSTTAAAIVSLIQPEQYTARASLLLVASSQQQQLAGTAGSTVSSAEIDRRVATTLDLLEQEALAEAVADRLGIDSGVVSNAVSTGTSPASDVVTISAEADRPELAADLANTYAEEFVEQRRASAQRVFDNAIAQIQGELADLGSAQHPRRESQLRRQVSRLEVIRALQTGNVELTDPAKPPASPSSPKVMLNITAGLAAGLVIGLGLMVILERADTRVRTAQELENTAERPILAKVPKLTGPSTRLPTGEGSTAIATLRTNLSYYNVDSPVRTLAITSAGQGDGKSTITWLLGVISALNGSNVLIIDADMRRPSLGGLAGIHPEPGLSELLAGQVGLEAVVTSVDLPAHARDAGTLDVIPAGGMPPNPSELVDSDRSSRLLEREVGHYDLVLIDTAPLGLVPDAVPLVVRADGALVVVRLGHSHRPAVAEVLERLARLDARVLGLVANSVHQPRAGYAYGYAYNYGSSPDPSVTTASSVSTPDTHVR